MEKSVQLSVLREALEIILNQGSNGNFVIYNLEGNDSYYIQIAAGKGSDRLWVEAATPDSLAKDQRENLKKLGWNDPSKGGLHNFFREYRDFSVSRSGEVASFMLQTFQEVYDLRDGQAIRPEVVLQ